MWTRIEPVLRRRTSSRACPLSPVITEFTRARLEPGHARCVTEELLSLLIASYRRYGVSIPELTRGDLDRASARWLGDARHPVNGWRYGLPIPVPARDRARVSRILGIVVSAIETRRTAIRRSGRCATTSDRPSAGTD